MSDLKFDPQTDIDITGLEWWEVLQRLHWATRARGPFPLNDRPLSTEHAIALIGAYVEHPPGEGRGFESINGRPMGISFHTRYGQSWVRGTDLYDRDAPVPAHKTISELRKDRRLRTQEY